MNQFQISLKDFFKSDFSIISYKKTVFSSPLFIINYYNSSLQFISNIEMKSFNNL